MEVYTMKKFTSMKICNNYKYVFTCKNNSLYHIFYDIEPAYYNSGSYGWNNDLYVDGDIIITTGYRNTRGAKIPENIINKYDKIARDIMENNTNYYEVIQPLLEKNRAAFLQELKTV